MKGIAWILFFFLVVTACNQLSFEEGDIIENLHGDITNEERLYRFYENIENKEQDAVRVISYTTEGDPIYQDLSYDGSGIESVEDSTEDQFGSGEVVTRKCESIVILSSKTEVVYVLEGCNPESGMDTILHTIE